MIRSKHRRPTRKRHTKLRAATTSQIIGGFPPAAARVPPKWKKYFQRLTELRNALLDQREDLSRDAREEKITFSEHMADAGTDSYDRDFALTMLSAEHDALYEIDHAIKRIELGAYGQCEVTGRKIEPERLDAIPWTRFSAQAARELERQGELKRAQLSRPGSVAKASDSQTVTAEGEDETSE
jgi:RNA polymerase-binding transcription factor DksA